MEVMLVPVTTSICGDEGDVLVIMVTLPAPTFLRVT
jgi:hypothetical protein